MARTMCLVKIQCVGSYDTIDAVVIIVLTIAKFVKYKSTWWCDGVVMMTWCNWPELMLPGSRSDCTLGYKTWHGFRAVIKSLTTQHNTLSTPTLVHFSSTMSMINSHQFRTPWGDIISVPRGLRPLWHHTGNSAYPASRLVGLWSNVVVDMYNWPLLGCGWCFAHWSSGAPFDLPHRSIPWWSAFWFEDTGLSLIRVAEGVSDWREQSLHVRPLELRYLGQGCNGYTHRCHLPRNPLFGCHGWTALEID